MAIIDLKNCTIVVRDGFSDTGAVNHTGGYVANDTTMVVDGIVGIIHKWSRFTVVGDDLEHVVVSTIETTGNTTSITFTPALADTVADNAVITFLANQIELVLGEGNLTYNEKKAREYKKNKGVLYEVRDGDEEPVEVSFDCWWENLSSSVTDGEPITFEEALKREGQAANWVSSDTTRPCSPYSVDIVIQKNQPCADLQQETTTLRYFRYEELDHSAKEGTIACKGSCNVPKAEHERA